ncbi:ATP-binding cassette domain-containing protein [Sulfidibacter corallicola]|uniref:ATP-binding cassette domain-containing protein n=1 Tax=Sulfidibacter corallicola TaxID=2818388 RepID=A0A8A4TKK2_SULCO|nr:ATP-binding cassette domain-containing protein [Sulfidibacter corallicola]QTD50007.1 ATP-binding cassette domain-containing protein [Sulfidibacter corallicola]
MIEAIGLEKTFKVPKNRGTKDRGEVADPRDQGKLFHALRGISFKCEKGRVLGMVGPNGAGKTTTLRVLSTALKPTAGRIMIDGEDFSLFPNEIRRRIGFLSGTTGLYPRLTAREMVMYFGRLHRVPQAELVERVDKLFDRFGMHGYANERNDRLSTGMKQKVNIVRTLIHDPSILIFDEPTTGLDIMSVQVLLEFIADSKRQQRTVIFSTHSLHEVEELCDEVVVIDQGVSKFHGTVPEFKRLQGSQDLTQAFMKAIGAAAPLDRLEGGAA